MKAGEEVTVLGGAAGGGHGAGGSRGEDHQMSRDLRHHILGYETSGHVDQALVVLINSVEQSHLLLPVLPGDVLELQDDLARAAEKCLYCLKVP